MASDQKVKTSPKDFFLYITSMAALYVSAVSLLTLWFQYINQLFPDPLAYYSDPFSGPIRFAIASLVIVFPLYYYLTRFLNKEIRQHPEKRELGIRKWLIYITLFIGGITIVVDLIVLINTFLGGDLTARFVLKVLAILVVIGGGFSYYLLDLKGKWEREPKVARVVGIIVSLVVLASVIAGFFIMGSPATQRNLRFDQEKINDLSAIQWQITDYWQRKEALPTTLSDLEDPLVGFIVPSDPQTNETYGYNVISRQTFELCANFNEESLGDNKSLARLEFGFTDENWEHGVGETCFERTIDPDRFPQLKPLPIR